MEPYERFDAWSACHALALEVYRVTERFPDRERYGLTSQARRAAFSAAVNIVEGSARRGHREFRHFLDYSLGSLAEVGYVFRFAGDLGIVDADAIESIAALHKRASILTWKLYHTMSRRSPPRRER